ncbi:MAG: hypothetical protein K2R98_17640 [Gemmataceae bacterium]|nr:hypothetical protein [Gemmataceae bacterium]
MSRFCLSVCLCLIGLGLCASSARSATIFIETLESAVNDSDQVVVGTMTEVKRVVDKQKIIWSTITFKVSETLKGEKKDELKFMAAHKKRADSDKLNALGDSKAEVVLCLVKSDRYKAMLADYAEQPLAFRVGPAEYDYSAIDLSDKADVLVATMDARLLSTKDDILKAARAAGTAPSVPNKPGRLRAPASSPVQKLNDGAVWLYAPVDKRLEAQAADWLKSKDIEYRVGGAKALWNFKTDDNIKVLKALLEDGQTQSDGKTKTYSVRQAAFEVLKEWGVEVNEPVTSEPDKG